MSRLKKEGKDIAPYQAKLKELSDEIKQMDAEITSVSKDFHDLELQVCNLPHESVPVGGEDANQESERWGNPGDLNSNPRPMRNWGFP